MVDTLLLVSGFDLFVAAVTATLASVAWDYRDRPGGLPLLGLTLAATALSVSNAFYSLFSDPVLTSVFGYAVYPLASAAVVSWFYLAVEFTGRDRFQASAVRIAVGAFLVVDVVVVATNPVHHLFTTADSSVTTDGLLTIVTGPLYWAHMAVTVSLLLAGIGLFIVAFVRARGIYRRQTGVLAAGSVVTAAIVFVQILGPTVVPGLDLTTVGLTIIAFAFLWAITRADFLETVPVARETLVESMDDAVVALDREDRVIDLNPRAQTLLGVDDSVVGAPAMEVFEDYADLAEQYEQTYEIETGITFERDGEKRHYDLNISPVTTEAAGGEEELLGRIIVVRDVTEKERQRRELQRQRETLQRQNDRLDKFASAVSHDLRNPLGVAQTYLDFAKDTGDDEDFEAVADSLDRMDEMIDDLLTMARVSSVIEETETVELGALAKMAWETTRTDGARLELPTTDASVDADPDLLQHVFENLFRNAVEHGSTDSGSQTRQNVVERGPQDSRSAADDSADHADPPLVVTVGTLDGDSADGFYIEDDGRGIPEDDREDVFDYGHTTSDEGTGFGLSIVADLVEVHGWEIRVTESDSGGARFEIET